MRIEFHRSRSGRSYFEDFLDELPKADQSVILAVFEDIRQHGFNALGCQFRQIDGKLWEIKIRTSGGGWRFFYVNLAADFIHVLHSYKKQGQKAPQREIELARKRLKEVLR
ncbi:MAG: type II toxin-antitoxin system RelE/ParE family toxin [Bdellovibrionales bacterium]|nr:type II toxin-antitoxin system RelE/ParE family toxin [Bdellovibrionales bacterium]